MSREQVRRPEIVVDLGAIRRNVGRLRDLVAPDGSDVMVVVKADGYGHGMLEAAHAAREAGAPTGSASRRSRRPSGSARRATPDASCAGSPSPATTGPRRSTAAST